MTATATQSAAPPTAGRKRTRLVSWVTRTAGCAASGILMWASFPPRNLWFLAVLSLAVLALQLHGVARARTAFWCGFVFGLAYFLPLLPWVGIYVGPLPWVALAVVMALYAGLLAIVAARVTALPWWPLWFALAWVGFEWVRSTFPFGGFPWGRAAFTQAEGPLLSIASTGGAPAVSFAVAFTGGALAALTRTLLTGPRQRQVVMRRAVVVLIMPALAGALWPSVESVNTGEEVTVAVIQGNVPRLGLNFNEQRRAVLDNHVRQTLLLAQKIQAQEVRQPSVVLWPENASDIDPTLNPDAAEQITAASKAVGAPIMVGTVLQHSDGRPTNSVLVWDGRTAMQKLPVRGRYDKQIIQPFGEYLPWRGFFEYFSPYAEQAGNFRPGVGPGVVTVSTAPGNDLTVGISTCWEVAFDRSARKAVRAGAQLLSVPTNNATFGRTEMTYQQLAMSQVRAVEHGRSVVVSATSGVSAVINPDGQITASTGIFEPGIMVQTIALHTERTVATTVGPLPERIAVVLTVLGLMWAWVRHRRACRLTQTLQTHDL
ncbi:apolipoprotein N-acyltransferase [Williamsia muralis]|uniref:apolipoprotein N-acyltransferase n=1 Tax=Williamsia marianensis TaxID=85044 RepID=UPI0009DE5DF5|nr:MAG: apolipoprotein N-acyltransferase [Gordonia sp. (in: high G+C Gram-positive bacteria)]